MNELSKEKTMTIKEVAEIFGVSVETITAKIRELFPGKMKPGKTTYLNEIEVTAIKLNSVKKYEPETDLEMLLLQKKLDIWKDEKIKLLTKQKEVAENQVKLLVHDFNKVYTTTEISKELNLKSAQELNNILYSKKIQYKQNGTWVLYSDYSDQGYTSIKETVLDSGKIVYDRLWTGIGRQFILNLFVSEQPSTNFVIDK